MWWSYSARCQQPADDGPARNDVRAQQVVRRVEDSTDISYQVAAQRLALWCGQVLKKGRQVYQTPSVQVWVLSRFLPCKLFDLISKVRPLIAAITA